MLNGAFDIAIRRAHPVTHHKGAIQIHHQATKKVGQQVLGGKADRQPANTTKGQHPGNAVAQRLQDHQCSSNHHRGAQQLANGAHRGLVRRLVAVTRINQPALNLLHQAQQEPRQQHNQQHPLDLIKHLLQRLIHLHSRNPGCPHEPHAPDHHPRRTARRIDQGIVPNVTGPLGTALNMIQHALDDVSQYQGRKHHGKDLVNPVFANQR